MYLWHKLILIIIIYHENIILEKINVQVNLIIYFNLLSFN